MLARPLLPFVVAALAACGGGASEPIGNLSAVQQPAEAAVGRGLAGIALVHLNVEDTPQAQAGVRQVGSAVRIQPGDTFMIGSTTKAMTAALAGRLVERGSIAWTTTLADALPDLAAGMQPAYRNVTLEQLLGHRGGVLGLNNADDTARFLAYLQGYAGTLPTTLAGRERFFAAWLLAQEPAARPGQDFHYSNGGYALAAQMLQARTGSAFADLFEQELARPLGLTVTWTAADAIFTDRPAGHEGPKGKLAAMAPEDADIARWLEVLRAGGCGTTMSPDSFAAWTRWHLRALRGEATPLAAGYLQRMKTLRVGDYAVGWTAADLDGRTVLTHDGEWRGFSSVLVMDPQGRSASFGITNTESDDGSWTLEVLSQAVLDVERALPPK